MTLCTGLISSQPFDNTQALSPPSPYAPFRHSTLLTIKKNIQKRRVYLLVSNIEEHTLESIPQPETLPVKDLASLLKTQCIEYSVGVMAYNEEANIGRTLDAILNQIHFKTALTEIIVVASGCTDNTVGVVEEMMASEPRIQLLVQERREGKASAINLFLQRASSSILVMVGADIIPELDTLEQLCTHFLDTQVGMVGAHPIPVNDQETFVGHAVHLLWLLHDRMARRSPKLGEVVAFRNTVTSIPTDTAVDEISIQAAISAQKLSLVYEPEALVYNKGPMTIHDFLRQRRRIHAGHLKIREQERYEAPTMSIFPILQELFTSTPYTVNSPKQLIWTVGTIGLEGLARLQGHYDVMRKRSHHVWQAVASTKLLEDAERKLRRISKTQSVIVFHIQREGGKVLDIQVERGIHTLLQKTLPALRKFIRRDDLLSVHGMHTLVAVLNAEQSGAEFVAQRLKALIETRLAANGQQHTPIQVRYHAVSFGQTTANKQ